MHFKPGPQKHLRGITPGPVFLAMVEKQVMHVIKSDPLCPPELRMHLLKTPAPARLVWFKTNLGKELSLAQGMRAIKGGVPYKKESLISLIHDFTKVFIQNCMTEAQRRYESDNERLRKEALIQEQKDMDATIDGKPQGAFEEAGVVINENQVGARK